MSRQLEEKTIERMDKKEAITWTFRKLNEKLKQEFKKEDMVIQYDEVNYQVYLVEKGENVAAFRFVYERKNGGMLIYLVDVERQEISSENKKIVTDLIKKLIIEDEFGFDEGKACLILSENEEIKQGLKNEGFENVAIAKPINGVIEEPKMKFYYEKGLKAGLYEDLEAFLRALEGLNEEKGCYDRMIYDITSFPLKRGAASTIFLKKNGIKLRVVYGTDVSGDGYYEIYHDYQKIIDRKKMREENNELSKLVGEYFEEKKLHYLINPPVKELLKTLKDKLSSLIYEVGEKVLESISKDIYDGFEGVLIERRISSGEVLEPYDVLLFVEEIFRSKDFEVSLEFEESRKVVYREDGVKSVNQESEILTFTISDKTNEMLSDKFAVVVRQRG